MASPNVNEAASARAKVEAMETAHPGVREAADAWERSQNAPKVQDPGPKNPAADFFSFLDKVYATATAVSEAAAAVAQGATEASRVRVSRTTRGAETYLTFVLPTATMVKVRKMNPFQQEAFETELLRRLEEELDKMIAR